MFSKLKKVMLSFVLLLVVASTGAWQNSSTALAAAGAPKIPLAPGLSWKNLGQSVRNIRINMKGDALALSGATFQATKKFTDGVPLAISDFYSNEALYKSGWSSDNAYQASDGAHQIFYHDSGYYLAVEYLKCASDPGLTCITVWESAQKDTAKLIPGNNPVPQARMSASAAWGKAGPVDDFAPGPNQYPNQIRVNPSSLELSWGDYGVGVQKYSYCVRENLECALNDPNWTGTYELSTSVIIGGLRTSKTYYWQVKAITGKDSNTGNNIYVLADDNYPWRFTTVNKILTISGTVHTAGATISYEDLTPKTVTSRSNGVYAFTVPDGWTGTVTPTKLGFDFAPLSRDYTAIDVSQTGQDYTATQITFTISGNVGVNLATLTYKDGTVKKPTSDKLGNYTITVPYGWSGTITPTKVGVSYFEPASMTYSNVTDNTFIDQNYIANRIATFRSIGADDGYIIESAMDSGVGGTTTTPVSLASLNSTYTYFRVGDNALAEQIRGILSFDTTTLGVKDLPDGNLSIVSAKLKLRRQSGQGANPFSVLGNLTMETVQGSFGGDPALESTDFEVLSDNSAGIVGTTPVGGYYVGNIDTSAFGDITGGLSQMRLAFDATTNYDSAANNVAFYSGNATIAYRPILEIIYTVTP